jgi:purine-binding chemotaxis protein CheW
MNEVLHQRALELKVNNTSKKEVENEDRVYFYILEFGASLIAITEGDVDEIQDELRITPIPAVTKSILGVINVRGSLISIINLKDYIHLDTSIHFERSKAKTILLNVGKFTSGILVSDVLEKIGVPRAQVDSVEGQVGVTDYISAVVPYNGKKVGVLDLRRILSNEEFIIDHR